MALSRYLRPIEYAGIDPSLARSVPPSILTEVSKEVKKAEAEAQPKKRGTYLTFTAKEKVRVATYGSINGAHAAVKRFSKEFAKDLKENTVRDWIKAYQKELQRKRTLADIGDELAVKELPMKKRGRPCLLRENLDAEVQTILKAMRQSGAVVNTSIAIATATGVVSK